MVIKRFLTLFLTGLVLFSNVSPVLAQEGSRERKAGKNDAKQKRTGVVEEIRQRFSQAAIWSGKVTGISGTTLTVSQNGATYTVLTGEFERCTTQYRRKFWGKSEFSGISVGNLVNVTGKWQNEEKTTIEACMVRNLSIQKRQGVFFGRVLSVSENGFVMSTATGNKGDQTVFVASSTKIVNRRGGTISFSEVKAGHKVRVKGMWDKVNSTITEVVEVKDFAILSNRPSVMPTPPVQ